MLPYHDYRPLADDKTVLRNPHKGWYFHYIDNGLTRPTYRDSATKAQILSIPGLNHLYLRFDWSDIEREEGVFDWSPLDNIMKDYQGLTFSLRMCTHEAGKIAAAYATPRWVNCRGEMINGCFEPDYNDPVYLEKLERFMQEYGRKYNGRPEIEFVDIGTFGTWGEGHTSGGSRKVYGADVLMKHINLHLRYFPDTQILVNDDLLRHPQSPEATAQLTQYCAGHGIGIRDDGVCVGYYSKTFGYDTLCDKDLYGQFTPFAPCDIELEHYHLVDEDRLKECLPYLEALKFTKATYSGFHGYPEPWMTKHRYFTEYCANRLGYWYFIDGMEFAAPVSGTKMPCVLHLSNRGFSKAYHSYLMRITAQNEKKCYLLNTHSPDNRSWEGNETEPLTLDFSKVPPGDYRLCIGLYEGNRPIQLAMRQDLLQPDGSYQLESISVAQL